MPRVFCRAFRECGLPLALLLGALLLAPMPASAALFGGREELVSTFAKELRTATGAPALSVAVVQGGDLVFAEGFGLRLPETKVGATVDTQYRLGTLGELFTVALLARMVEAGEIELDVDVRTLVPGVAHYPAPVTPRMLAGHLGGVRHFRDAEEALNREEYPSVKAALARFAEDSLAAPPGTQMQHSAYGYVLLSRALEVAGGKPYLQLLEEHVLQPLGLESVVPDTGPLAGEKRAMGFDRAGGTLGRSALINLSDRWAAAGLLGSAVDLARFGAAHLRERFFQAETQEFLFTPQVTVDGEKLEIGLGWKIQKGRRGRTFYSKEGATLGGRTVLYMDPEADLVVALAASLGGAGFGTPDAAMIADLYRLPEETEIAPEELEGSYEYTQSTDRGESVTGELVLEEVRRDSVQGYLQEGDTRLPLRWGAIRDGRLLLAARDPAHQLELLWLRPRGEKLVGRTWRERDHMVAKPIPAAENTTSAPAGVETN